MSRPVSFKQFGINDRTLYRQYLDVYRAEEQLERDEFQVLGGDFSRCWKDSRVDVAGGRGGVGRGRIGAIQRAISWRPVLGDGGADHQAGTVRSVGGVGAEPSGVSVGGVGGCNEGRGDSGGRCGDAPGGGDRRVGGARAGGAEGEDGSFAGGEGGGAGGSKSTSVVSGVVARGKNYEKNKAKRERAKAQRKAGNVSDRGKTLVSVRAAHPRLDDTWAERKIRENEMAIARMDAQMAKMKREQEDGTAEKRYKVEANLVQGQLDGAFALVPQQRVVSWAKTITSNGSSSTGSSGGKKSRASIPSVSSGLGSGSATTVSAREKKLEQENEKLRKDMEELQAAEIMKRSELRNAVDRKIHFRESEIISLKQKLQSYKAIYG